MAGCRGGREADAVGGKTRWGRAWPLWAWQDVNWVQLPCETACSPEPRSATPAAPTSHITSSTESALWALDDVRKPDKQSFSPGGGPTALL